MKKIILLLICILMCGCENSIITDEAKYKDNAFKDNNSINIRKFILNYFYIYLILLFILIIICLIETYICFNILKFVV